MNLFLGGQRENAGGILSVGLDCIYRSVSAMSSGSSNKPWTKKDGQTIVCCTDGVRPVVFCVEAFGENVYLWSKI